MPRLRLHRDPAQLGELVDGGVAAEASVAGGLHAAERHLRLVVHRRAVDVADARLDALRHLERPRDVAR